MSDNFLERLIDVLVPFAKAADIADDYERSDDYDTEGLMALDCGDLRAARTMLAEVRERVEPKH